MNKFVIFTVPRSGSTLLVKSLDSHPQIFCAGEMFLFAAKTYHAECQYRFWRLPFLNKKLNYLLNYPRTFLSLDRFMNAFYQTTNDIKAKGFKLMYYQTLYTPGLVKYLRKNKVKVILLQRENILRNALSDQRARTTGVYHNNGDEVVTLPKMTVAIHTLQSKMQQLVKSKKLLEETIAGLDALHISYEALNDNWDEAMDKVLRFLEVEPLPLKTAVKKLNPEKLDEMIENYSELKQWLQRNNFESFLQEDNFSLA